MRELKFRAWDANDKRYRYAFNMDDLGKVIEYVDGEKVYMPYTVEQYTGLKDENGKEIYEGDIVALIADFEEPEIEDCNVITFSNGCFRVGEGVENYAGKYLSDWRIVGNIHENPELLKEMENE